MSRRPPGKKIGALEVEVEGLVHKLDLRLEVSSGTFYAELDHQWYEANTKAKLSEKLAALLRERQQLAWVRYLDIRYESDTRETSGRGGWYLGNEGLDARAPDEVSGVSLSWTIREFARHQEPEGLRYLERDPSTRKVERFPLRELPSFAVEYTEEREAVLMQLRAALTAVDRKMRAFFGREAKSIAAALDRGFAASGLPALPMPEREPHLQTCKSLDRSCNCGADDGDDHEDWCREVKAPSCNCGRGDDGDA